MLTLLSPAKKLTTDIHYDDKRTTIQFEDLTCQLVKILKKYSKSDIAQLMGLSDKLAELNFERYQNFSLDESIAVTGPAAFMFQGDVYQTLTVEKFSKKALTFAQSHLAILSGLYGLLRPLDNIYPYRLEMGTKLASAKGKNLYEFWQPTLTQYLNQCLDKHKNSLLINLASNEYSQAIDKANLCHPMVDIVFKEQKAGKERVIGIYAKKARGMMANFIMTNQLDTLEELTNFNQGGYQLDKKQSNDQQLIFVAERSS